MEWLRGNTHTRTDTKIVYMSDVNELELVCLHHRAPSASEYRIWIKRCDPSEHALENPEALPSVRENPFCWVSLWSGYAEEPNLALPSDHRSKTARVGLGWVPDRAPPRKLASSLQAHLPHRKHLAFFIQSVVKVCLEVPCAPALDVAASPVLPLVTHSAAGQVPSPGLSSWHHDFLMHLLCL